MKYLVKGWRSATCCSAFGVQHLRDTPDTRGPYVYQSKAKREAARWRVLRVTRLDSRRNPVDLGPWFREVEIIEVPE